MQGSWRSWQEWATGHMPSAFLAILWNVRGGASQNDLTVSSCVLSSPEARVPGTGLFPLTHSCHLPLVTPSHPLLSSQFAHLKTGSQNELIYRIEALPLVLT